MSLYLLYPVRPVNSQDPLESDFVEILIIADDALAAEAAASAALVVATAAEDAALVAEVAADADEALAAFAELRAWLPKACACVALTAAFLA